MQDRERFVRHVLGLEVDRPPYWLYWGPWGTTWQRWERENKPASVTDHRMAFPVDFAPCAVPVNAGPCPVFEQDIVDEGDYYQFTDTWGIRRRILKGRESMPEFISFPVQDAAGWKRYKEERLNLEHPGRLAGDWRQHVATWMKEGRPIQLGYFPDVGFFGGVRWLLGDEQCLTAFYTDPELVHDIMGHLATLYLHVFEVVVQECKVDVIHIWEDMCGRNGPLISPALWEEFMGPQYRRVRDFAHRHDIPVISVDTDGDPDLIIQPMIDAGVNLLFPCEVAAGCDVNVMRKKHPDMALMGGIDKRALADGPSAIDTELERIRPALEGGKYIPDLDHLVPDDVSWDNYDYYALALARMHGIKSQ